MSNPWPFNPRDWDRAGHGSTLEFYATDEDVERYFRALPAEFAPYGIVGVASVKKEKGLLFEEQAFVDDLGAWFARIRQSSSLPKTSYWVWSGEPPRIVSSGTPNHWCAVNGLIDVQHPNVYVGKRGVSRIAIVNKIVHVATGQKHEHRRQSALFRSIKKAIKADLVFSTMHDLRDGRIVEDERARLMTAAAAEFARTGAFDRMPGRRLK